MKYRITASNTQSCRIELPASKSISNRALIIGALGGLHNHIHNMAVCNDTVAMFNALEASHHNIDIGDAGTAMRFLTAYFATTPGKRILTGSLRMQQRPIGALVDALRDMGASISYGNCEGYPPLIIEGKALRGGDITIRGDISSQYITALLLIAPYTLLGINLTIEGNILSRPYIDMTISLMQHYGIDVVQVDNTITVQPGKYNCNKPLSIPFDWSAASYWYLIAYLNGCEYLLNSCPNSLQGDERIVQYFNALDINTRYDNNHTIISPQYHHNAPHVLELNLQDTPDVAQTIIVGCVLRKQYFKITGLDNLHIKETNRIAALISETAKLGVILTQPCKGTLQWYGESCPITKPIVIDTHNDHRMAMAFAPAAIIHGEVWIENPQVVEKSYPTYWSDLSKAGFYITNEVGKEIQS